VPEAWLADRPLERMQGLLGRPALLPGQALLISPCSSVHTFGMRYPLDIVFMSPSHQVLKIVPHLSARRIAWCWGAKNTVELAAGETCRLDIQVGNILVWRT